MSFGDFCKGLYTNLLVINYVEFNVILGMDLVNTFYIVIDCRKRSLVFKISKYLEFEFLGASKFLELAVYREKPTCLVLAVLDANEKLILVVMST